MSVFLSIRLWARAFYHAKKSRANNVFTFVKSHNRGLWLLLLYKTNRRWKLHLNPLQRQRHSKTQSNHHFIDQRTLLSYSLSTLYLLSNIRLWAWDLYLNNRTFLSRNYRLIVVPRKHQISKGQLPRHKHSIVFIVRLIIER